ncbi:hypothetical protein AGMMS50268_09260 [Spirochaetia bacterium]|nr:hypothetical protein AGMMS50268_09260 [Spirochaetia bacterium]
MNNIKCECCNFGIPVDTNEQRLLCDNPALPTYGKNVKYDRDFSCGNGVGYGKPMPVPELYTPPPSMAHPMSGGSIPEITNRNAEKYGVKSKTRHG